MSAQAAGIFLSLMKFVERQTIGETNITGDGPRPARHGQPPTRMAMAPARSPSTRTGRLEAVSGYGWSREVLFVEGEFDEEVSDCRSSVLSVGRRVRAEQCDHLR